MDSSKAFKRSAEVVDPSAAAMRELAQLSPEQREVAQAIIDKPGSNFAVSAPPGTGKTTTMSKLLSAVLGPKKCDRTGRVKAFVVAPTNLALMQWQHFKDDSDVYLTTSASLVGRGVTSPLIPPSTATFTRKCRDIQNFLMGRQSEPTIDLVLILWDEFWNTAAEDVDNGLEIMSKVLQTTCTTIVFMGDPFQHKPVEGASPLLSAPFHELSRSNIRMLPGLARRPLLKNLMTIPGESRRVCDAPEDIVELVSMAGSIEKLLRVGNWKRAEMELETLQSCTAGLVVPPGEKAVYLTARRDRQWHWQLKALAPLTESGVETHITGNEDTPVERRTCIAVGHEHKLIRYVKNALQGGAKSSAKISLPNGMRGKVTKLVRAASSSSRGRKRKRDDGEDLPPYEFALFSPHGHTGRPYQVPVTSVTTVTASTTHGAQGITMPDGKRVIFDCENAQSVYRTQADVTAAFIVALSRAKNAPTIVMNFERGLFKKAQDSSKEEIGLEKQVSDAFLRTVQRLTAGRVTSIVPNKVRLKTPSRQSLQVQLNKAYNASKWVRIRRWNADTSTATLESGLCVQAI